MQKKIYKLLDNVKITYKKPKNMQLCKNLWSNYDF